MKTVERSKCVVCGKKRDRKFLKQIDGLWICCRNTSYMSSRTIFLKSNITMINKGYHECIIKYFKSEYKHLFGLIEKFNKSINEHIEPQFHQAAEFCPFRADKITAVK